jgi:putative tricarboxylic transport membrane protein
VIMLVFGVVGYFMKKLDYEPAPLILALVLGRMAEESIRQTLVLSRGSLGVLFQRPISCVALILVGIIIFSPLILPPIRGIFRKAKELV